MTSRGAVALIGGAMTFALAFAGTGGQIFTRIYTKAPVNGTGSSGSALSYAPDIDVGSFGDCSDGDLVVAADATMVGDHFYRNVTINAGKTLRTAGPSGSYALYVCQTLTFVDAASNISSSGNPGDNGFFTASGGAAIPAGTLPGGGLGGGGGVAGTCLSGDAAVGVGPGGVTPAPNRFVSGVVTAGAGGGGVGSDGDIGQGGGGGGGATGCATGRAGGAPAASVIFPTYGDPREIFQGMAGRTIDSVTTWGSTQGGGGGGAGNINGGTDGGGGGGGGAAWMVVGARNIVGPGGISAIGGNGGSGGPTGGGGGAGGSGGVVVVTTETCGWSALSVLGGTGGAGGGSVPHGGAGGKGGAGLAIVNHLRCP